MLKRFQGVWSGSEGDFPGLWKELTPKPPRLRGSRDSPCGGAQIPQKRLQIQISASPVGWGRWPQILPCSPGLDPLSWCFPKRRIPGFIPLGSAFSSPLDFMDLAPRWCYCLPQTPKSLGDPQISPPRALKAASELLNVVLISFFCYSLFFFLFLFYSLDFLFCFSFNFFLNLILISFLFIAFFISLFNFYSHFFFNPFYFLFSFLFPLLFFYSIFN